MPVLTIPIVHDGPIVQIGIRISAPRGLALAKAKLPIPPAVITTGLIDTGASITCIDKSVIAKLGLVPTGSCPIYSASSGTAPQRCDLYDVSLTIFMDASQVQIASLTIPVAEIDLSQAAFDALIGRDVLQKALMVYNGAAATVSLTF